MPKTGRPPRTTPTKPFSCDLEEAYISDITQYQDYFHAQSATGTRPSKGDIIQTALDALAATLHKTAEAGRSE